jgi:hypothetical protein
LATILLASAALSACGGGGTNSPDPVSTVLTNNTTTVTTTPAITPTVSQPTPTSSSPSNTGTPTSSTGTVTSTVTAAYNLCADTEEATDPSSTSRQTSQTYVYSGLGGDGSVNFTTTNQAKAAFKGAGSYFVRSVVSTSTLDGLAIPSLGGGAAELSNTVSYYERRNGLLGLVGSETYSRSDNVDTLQSTYSYSPVFFDNLFTLSASQTAFQTRTFTQTSTFSSAASFSESQKVKYLGTETFKLGNKDYTVCKYEVQNTSPASQYVITRWYLAGRGILLESRTFDTTTSPATEVRTIRLERATDRGQTIFPAQ